MPMPPVASVSRGVANRDAADAWDALVEKTPASERVLASLRAPMPALLVGFDGSLTAFGWSIVTIEAQPRVLRAGCVTTKPEAKTKHQYQADRDGARVDEIADGLLDALDWALGHGVPVLVAIEAPAGAQHAQASKALGLSYGLSRAVCRARKVTPITVQAFECKAVCGGSKGASKDDLARGVERMTGWKSTAKTAPAREGESDAVGVALTAMRHPIADALRPRAAPQSRSDVAVRDLPGPLHANHAAESRTLMGSEHASPVRAPRGLSTGGLGPKVVTRQLSADQSSRGEEETRGA